MQDIWITHREQLHWKWPEGSDRSYDRQQQAGYPEQGGWLWGTVGVATCCTRMVQWFNQQPVKKLKISKLAQNQNRHQKRIPHVKTNQMSGVERVNYTEYKPNYHVSCLLQPLTLAGCRHFSDTRIWLISVTFTGGRFNWVSCQWHPWGSIVPVSDWVGCPQQGRSGEPRGGLIGLLASGSNSVMRGNFIVHNSMWELTKPTSCLLMSWAQLQKRSDHCHNMIGTVISHQLTISWSNRIPQTILLRLDYDPGDPAH